MLNNIKYTNKLRYMNKLKCYEVIKSMLLKTFDTAQNCPKGNNN